MGKASQFLKAREEPQTPSDERAERAAKVAAARAKLREELREEADSGPCPSCFRYGCWGCNEKPPKSPRKVKIKRERADA